MSWNDMSDDRRERLLERSGLDETSLRILFSPHCVSVLLLVPKPYRSNWHDQILVCMCGWRAVAGPACPAPCEDDGHPCALSMVEQAHTEHALSLIDQ